MTSLDSMLKSRDMALPAKFPLFKAMAFPVVLYGCENWTVRRLIDDELMLLNCSVQSLSRVQLFATPWTAAPQAALSITNSRNLLELIHVPEVGDSIQPSHPQLSPSLPAFSLFAASGSFPVNQFFE